MNKKAIILLSFVVLMDIAVLAIMNIGVNAKIEKATGPLNYVIQKQHEIIQKQEEKNSWLTSQYEATEEELKYSKEINKNFVQIRPKPDSDMIHLDMGGRTIPLAVGGTGRNYKFSNGRLIFEFSETGATVHGPTEASQMFNIPGDYFHFSTRNIQILNELIRRHDVPREVGYCRHKDTYGR